LVDVRFGPKAITMLRCRDLTYDNGGQQTFDWQVYARIIEGIRAQVDVSVYPSYPALMTASIGAGASQEDGAERPAPSPANR
jgi:hypothetical protein